MAQNNQETNDDTKTEVSELRLALRVMRSGMRAMQHEIAHHDGCAQTRLLAMEAILARSKMHKNAADAIAKTSAFFADFKADPAKSDPAT